MNIAEMVNESSGLLICLGWEKNVKMQVNIESC